MSDLTPEQAQQIAADQLAGQAAAAPAPDAGPSLEAMQQQHRDVLLPMETRINDLMASFQASQDAQARQIAELQAQLAAARQDAGAPAVETYAAGVLTLLKAHAAANPDVADQIKPALAVADQLAAAAADAVTTRDPSEVTALAGQVEKFIGRFRGKHLDWSGVLADLELLGEAAARLAA